MGEAITLFCTILGAILAYLTFKGTTVDELEESRQMLIEDLDLLKRMNGNLLKDLYDYGNDFGKFHEVFMNELTLEQCIDILQKARDFIFTEENMEALKKTRSKRRIADIQSDIKLQIKHHAETQTRFDYYIKPHLG